MKTDANGKVSIKVPVANYHGDLCINKGKLYVAVNLGRFNDPDGHADLRVYVYDARTLKELARHEIQQVVYGSGGIGCCDGHFFVVGDLPDAIKENYVCEYDGDFNFIRRHVINSGHTHLGIQTATFTNNRWWFGCYGQPSILLVTDGDFRLVSRYEFDCSLGIVGLPHGRFLVGGGRCSGEEGCVGWVRVAERDEKNGLRIVGKKPAISER